MTDDQVAIYLLLKDVVHIFQEEYNHNLAQIAGLIRTCCDRGVEVDGKMLQRAMDRENLSLLTDPRRMIAVQKWLLKIRKFLPYPDMYSSPVHFLGCKTFDYDLMKIWGVFLTTLATFGAEIMTE